MCTIKSLSVAALLLVMLVVGQSMGVTLYPNQFVSIWSDTRYVDYTGWNSGVETGDVIGWAGGINAAGGDAIYDQLASVTVGADDFSIGNTATLHVNVVAYNNPGWGLPMEIKIHPLTASYVLGQASYLTRSSGVNWTNPGGDYDAGVFSTLTLRAGGENPEGAHQADITALLEYWETHPNYGMIMVVANNDGGCRTLGWNTHATGAPYIEIVPEPATMLLLAAGGLLLRRKQ